jgi:formate hydrogenlyase transcriptional activator
VDYENDPSFDDDVDLHAHGRPGRSSAAVSSASQLRVDELEISDIAIDASPSGIVVCEEDGTIVLANHSIEAQFGYSAAELLGAKIDMLVPAASRAAHARERSQFWRNPRARIMGAGRTLYGRRKDGSEIAVEIGLTVTTRAGRRLVVASVVDITERLERENATLAAAAEQVAFEQLISELAARFVNVPIEDVDAAIVESQRQIVEMLDLDRSALWQVTDDGNDYVHTHAWFRPGHPPVRSRVSTKDGFSWVASKIRANEPVWNQSLDDIPDARDRENLRGYGTKSNAILPLSVDGRVIGALTFGAIRAERSWSAQVRSRLTLMASVFAQALARRQGLQQLRSALAEVDQLRARLAVENSQLRQEVGALKGPRVIAAESESVRAVLRQIESVAPTNATVLLLGETGCGKEVFAQAIHDNSKRRDRPMVRVNCAAIPTALVENELFGRERGAYTGALSKQIGRFEIANGSTLFLDEIGDLPLESQVKLLRVVQDHVIERLGSTEPIHVDIRLIAATNRDLSRAVADGTFREDLFYRLNVFPIQVPPLRSRVEDIQVLVWSFAEEFSKSCGKRIESISRDSLAALRQYAWPGNVRELKNLVERAVILSSGNHLVIEPPQTTTNSLEHTALVDVDARHILSMLESANWRIRGPHGAAELLGMKPTTLESRMAKLGIRRPRA